MHFSVPFLSILPLLVSAIVIPNDAVRKDVATTEPSRLSPSHSLEDQQTQSSVAFSVPCLACFENEDDHADDESLAFYFQAFASKEACGIYNLTLNGVDVAAEWVGTHAQTTDTIEVQGRARKHLVDIEIQASCLFPPEESSRSREDDVAQVFTATVKRVDGNTVHRPTGFTVSYKQLSQPEILRLTLSPDYLASELEFSEDWRDPPAHLRSSKPGSEEHYHYSEGSSEAGTDLEVSALEPKTLQEELLELRKLQAESWRLRKKICNQQSIIKGHIQTEAVRLKDELKQCPDLACVWHTVITKAHGAIETFKFHFQQNKMNLNQPPTYLSESQPSNNTSDHSYNSLSSDVSDDPYDEDAFHKYNGYLLHAAVVVLCCGCVFSGIRRCRNRDPRRRAERAERREERRNRRLYRRSACRHSWRTWWASWRQAKWDRQRITDYEEKRALVSSTEDLLESQMQDEIRALREAHTAVNQMVQAEEGRSTNVCPPYQVPQQRARNDSYPIPLSRTNSLPDYSSDAGSFNTEPPAYTEDDEGRDGTITDGFAHYTPTGSGSSDAVEGDQWTPDSSVIDVSPRMSFDTTNMRFGYRV